MSAREAPPREDHDDEREHEEQRLDALHER